MSKNKKFVEYLKREIQTRDPSDEYTAAAYKYLGDEEKVKQTFQHVITYGFRLSSSRFGGLIEEDDRKKTKLLIQTGELQLKEGIYCIFAKTNPKKATQLFEWAAENCLLPDEYIADETKAENYDDIAVGHLWRGYALLNLGRPDEAYDLLIQVVPYLNRYKKLGIEMWRKVEYALPKALIPLCEFKLDPTQKNLQKAQNGIEDYIKSLRDNKDKLEGYLYYFHLKEAYPDVYNTDKVLELPAGASPKINKPARKMDLPPDEYDTKGSVIVFDIKSGSLEVFGTNNELEEYVGKIKNFVDYPVLSDLMELYATEGQQEPEPLIKECERLLLRVNIDAALKEKTEFILAVAKDAKNENSTVMLYFDPEVE